MPSHFHAPISRRVAPGGLAGHADEFPAAEDSRLDSEERQHDQDQQQRQGAGPGVVGRGLPLDQTVDLGRQDVDAGGLPEQQRGGQQAHAQDEAQDHDAEDRRPQRGDLDLEEGPQPARPADHRRLFQRGVERPEGAQQQEVLRGGGAQDAHADHPVPGLHVDRGGTEDSLQCLVDQPTGLLPEHGPAERVEERWNREDQHRDRGNHPPQRRPGPGDQPGEINRQGGRHHDRGARQDQGIQERLPDGAAGERGGQPRG